MARSWRFLGVVGLLFLFVPSPPSFCISGACTQSTPAATATIGGSPVALRTTHDEINFVTTSGVVENEVRAIAPFLTMAPSASLDVRNGDTLESLGGPALPANIVGTSPPVLLDDDMAAEFVSRTDAAVNRINLSGSFVPMWGTSLRRAGCGSDTLSAPPVVHLRRRATAAFKAAYTTDLVYVGTFYQSVGGAACAGDTTQNKVVALNAATGDIMWQFNGDGLTSTDVVVGLALDRTTDVQLDPQVDIVTIRQEDTLFVTTERRASVSQNSIWAIDVVTGTLRWGRNAGRTIGPPTVSTRYDDRIYVTNRAGQIRALRKSDGSEIWSHPTGSVPLRNAAVDPSGADPRIAVVDALGRLALIRDNDTTVETIWNAELPIGPVPGGITTAPAVRAISRPLMDDPGHVYVGASDGKIYQLDIETGEILTTRTLDGDGTATVRELALQSPATPEAPAFLVAISSEGHIAKYCVPFCRDSGCAAVPVATDDIYSTDEDTVLAVASPGVLLNDTGTGSPLIARLVDAPSHGTVALNDDGSFIYSPSTDFSGSDSFSYKVIDGSAESTVANVSITVVPMNDRPVAVDGTLITDRETPKTGVLIASDVDSPALSFSVVSNGSKGTASIVNAATGAYSYVPHAGAVGVDSFTFKASDGTLESNTATVHVTINDRRVTVVAPNGGETLIPGTIQEIRWTFSGATGPKVKIELLKDGVVSRVIKGKAPIGAEGQGSFLWTIPVRRIEGSGYRIRITSTTVPGVTDTSDLEFKILRP